MTTLTAGNASLPETPSLLRVRRGLFEPYDIVVASFILTTVIVSVYGSENLLRFRDWMFPNLIRFSVHGAVALVLLTLISLVNRRVREGKLSGGDWKQILLRYFSPRTLLRVFRFIVALEVTLLFYTSIKQRFSRLHPILYDDLMIKIEKFVHFGWNPAWDLAAINWPSWFLIFVDRTYWAWFPLKFLMLTYALTMKNAPRRDRFLAAYLGCWMAAVLVGLSMPSNGPFYVDETPLFPAGDNVEMYVAALFQVRLHVHYLVDLVPGKSGILVYGRGLMAMPSLHVAIAALYMIFGWRQGRFLRWFTVLFFALIFLGSMLTGWHYAIDGYVGVAIAAGLWYGIGYLQRRFDCAEEDGDGPRSSAGAGSGI